METRHSLDGIGLTVLSQLNAVRTATAALAEERRLAEESAQQQIAKSEAALREASEGSYPKDEMTTSSDSYYGPTSPERATSQEKEIEEVVICTPDSEGLSTGTVVELDENGIVVIGCSSSCIPKRVIRERRIRGMRVWRSTDAEELIRSLVSAVVGCFHGMLCMVGMRRNGIADETTPLVSRAEV